MDNSNRVNLLALKFYFMDNITAEIESQILAIFANIALFYDVTSSYNSIPSSEKKLLSKALDVFGDISMRFDNQIWRDLSMHDFGKIFALVVSKGLGKSAYLYLLREFLLQKSNNGSTMVPIVTNFRDNFAFGANPSDIVVLFGTRLMLSYCNVNHPTRMQIEVVTSMLNDLFGNHNLDKTGELSLFGLHSIFDAIYNHFHSQPNAIGASRELNLLVAVDDIGDVEMLAPGTAERLLAMFRAVLQRNTINRKVCIVVTNESLDFPSTS